MVCTFCVIIRASSRSMKTSADAAAAMSAAAASISLADPPAKGSTHVCLMRGRKKVLTRCKTCLPMPQSYSTAQKNGEGGTKHRSAHETQFPSPMPGVEVTAGCISEVSRQQQHTHCMPIMGHHTGCSNPAPSTQKAEQP